MPPEQAEWINLTKQPFGLVKRVSGLVKWKNVKWQDGKLVKK
jgi:hypothetical protein